MALLMCHNTLTQCEIPGLINNTLPNKNLKATVMDVHVHCILIEILNGKQVGPASSMLTSVEVIQTIRTKHALAQTLSSRVYTLRLCNAQGCEYGRCETLLQCSNAGPLSSMAASVGVLWTRVRTLSRLFLMMIDCCTLPPFQNQ